MAGLLVATAPASAATGLAGRWTLDEGGGLTAADASGNGNGGTLSAGVQWVAGKAGSALAFNGAGGQLRIPSSSALETPAVTVEAWVRRQGSPGAFKYIAAKGATTCSAAAYGIYTGPEGGIQFYVSSRSGMAFTRSPDGGSGVWDGRWHLVMGSFDGATVRLYVDGAEVGSGAPESVPLDYGTLDTRDVFVGRYPGCAGLDFDGSIDDVRIYGRALSAAEVAAERSYAFRGFLSPIDVAPTVNVVKAGSSVPVKFSLGGFQGLDGLLAAGSPGSQKVACATNAPQDEIEQTATAGSSTLSYDAVSDQYSYVWKTDKSWVGTCRQLMVTLDDGIPHTAAFRFK
jgi:hypothetical protein